MKTTRRGASWVVTALGLALVLASCSSSSYSLPGSGTQDGGHPSVDGASPHDATSSSKDGAGKKDAGFVSHDAGTDCGGRTGNPCGDGAVCKVGTDCQSGLCKGGVCVAPSASCNDGKKDGSETDVDCGGSQCAPCGTGKDCKVATDCVSDVCSGGTCQAASDTDGVKNDSETDVDCGGGLQSSGSANPSSDGAPACAPGKMCVIATDCSQGVCDGTPPGAADAGVTDGGGVDATAVDASAPDAGGVLYCQPASPTDGVQNDSETDVDCGGGVADGAPNPMSDGAPACAIGQKCLVGTDCQQGVCNANGGMGGGPADCPAGSMCICQPPSPTDGVQNDSETDVDCGGSASLGSDGAPGCAPGLKCLVGSDCQSFICASNGTCTAPSPTDGVKNDSETDVDCGGATLAAGGANPNSDGAPACADEKGCLIDPDCLSSFCSLISNTCVDGQSCKGLVTPAAIMDLTGVVNADGTTTLTVDANGDPVGTPDPNGAGQNAGIDTCGSGEATDPIGNQTHESCCRSLLLPAGTDPTPMRMDKYLVTSGRMRQFLESLTYDVRDWAFAQFDADLNPITAAGTNLAAQLPVNVAGSTNALTFLPTTSDTTVPLDAVIETGVIVLDQAGVQGCTTKVGDDGAETYWWDGATQANFMSPPRAFTQDYYDIKPMNCVPYFLAVAFCAWDGGRMMTQTEHDVAWGAQTYPWGPALIPNPYPGNQQMYTVAACGGADGIASNAAVGCTIDWYNGGQAAGSQGDFYYYPSFVANIPNGFVPDTLSNGLDLSVYIGAPGRFFLDRTITNSTSFAGNEGWQDLGANMLELAPGAAVNGGGEFCDVSGVFAPGEVSNCTGTNYAGATVPGFIRGTGQQAPDLLGGSWEGHGPTKDYCANCWSVYRQYGKTGVRCVRPAEP